MDKNKTKKSTRLVKAYVTEDVAMRLDECRFIRRHPNESEALREALSVYSDWVRTNYGDVEIKRAPVQPAPKIAKVR